MRDVLVCGPFNLTGALQQTIPQERVRDFSDFGFVFVGGFLLCA